MFVKSPRNINKNSKSKIIDADANEINALRQAVILTKQNQFLKMQVDGLRQEIQRIYFTKKYYKRKYKQLKLKMKILLANQKTMPLALKQNFGRIYTQPIRYNTSQNQIKKQIQQRNQVKKSQLRKIQSEGKFHTTSNKIVQEQNNPYQFRCCTSNLNIGESLQKINTGIQGINRVLQLIQKGTNNNQNEVSKFYEKFQTFQNTFIQLKDNIIKLGQKDNNYEHQQYRSRDLVTRDKSYSENLPLKQNKYKQDDEEMLISGINPPQKDLHNINADSPYQNYYPLKDKQKKSLMLQKNVLSYQGIFKVSDTVPKSERKKYNSSNKLLLKPSKSNSKKGSSRSSSRQNWEMLYQIGKNLKNWKFNNEDSQLLQKPLTNINKLSSSRYKKQ